MWLGRGQVGELRSKALGQDRISDSFRNWGTNVPLTTLVKHVPGLNPAISLRLSSLTYPGYTILDNVIIMNGTVHVITDEADSFPSLASISSQNVGLNKWRVLSSRQAIPTIGLYGGVYVFNSRLFSSHHLFSVQGVTWMSTDYEPRLFRPPLWHKF